MKDAGIYLLDTNVFIEAKNSYYGFAVCPGFWSSILGHFKLGSLCSIDHVQQEILRGKDDLADWVTNEVPAEFFRDTGEEAVHNNYTKIMHWAQRNQQFFSLAKAEFAASADGWLIAYAMAKKVIVVTHEQTSPNARNRIPIPNICKEFGVDYEDTFFMLERLKIRFEWNG